MAVMKTSSPRDKHLYFKSSGPPKWGLLRQIGSLPEKKIITHLIMITWIVNDDICGFPQPLQANTGIVPRLSDDCFFNIPSNRSSHHPTLQGRDTEKVSLCNSRKKK
jgi:hypothetical protein